MSDQLKVSQHAMKRYSIRTGTPPIKAITALRSEINAAKPASIEEACQLFPLTRIDKHCSYLIWTNNNINEKVLAIIKNNTVITVLTQNMFGYDPTTAKKYRVMNLHGKLVKMDSMFEQDVMFNFDNLMRRGEIHDENERLTFKATC